MSNLDKIKKLIITKIYKKAKKILNSSINKLCNYKQKDLNQKF